MTKIRIETYGCSANIADSESIAALVKDAGYILTSEDDYDLIIVNTCTVKTPTETKIFRRLSELKNSNKKVIVAGCIPQAEPQYSETKLKDFSIVGVFDIYKIKKAIESTLNGERVVFLDRNPENKSCLPKIRFNDIIEIVPISEGCLGSCAYCKTKHARGNLFSFPIEEILNQVKKALKAGAKEIWITSQDTGCYGFDINTTLPELLDKIIQLEGDFRIRIGMMNPDHALKILPELISIYKNEKIFKFIHIPVQAGSNSILKLMRREYSVEDFKKLVNELRKNVPQITFSTDVILGFPGETLETFEETVELVKWLSPDVLNISRYWERKGTISSQMENKLHTRDTKEMSRKLAPLFDKLSLAKNKKYINKEYSVLVDEKGRFNSYISRTDSYKPIVIKSEEDLMGKQLFVKIIELRKNYFLGRIKN